MIIVDDLLKSVGVLFKPFNVVWMMELLRDYALKEKYNIKEINNKIKENRLLFELREITEEEYNKKRKILLEEFEMAKEINEKLANARFIEEK